MQSVTEPYYYWLLVIAVVQLVTEPYFDGTMKKKHSGLFGINGLIIWRVRLWKLNLVGRVLFPEQHKHVNGWRHFCPVSSGHVEDSTPFYNADMVCDLRLIEML